MALILAHSVQWSGDRLSYSSWNIEGRKIGLPRWGSTAKPRLHGFVYDLEQKLDKLQGHDVDADVGHDETDLSKFISDLKDLDGSLIAFGSYAFFYVYIWHFVVPVCFALFAVW